MALDTARTIQAAAVLLRQEHCEQMGYLRLMKLLYIADRESLKETGRPITGDRAVAMEHGPVLTNVLNIIKDEDSRSSEWRKFFKRENYLIEMVNDPGVGQLSRFAVRKLEEVARRHSQMDVWEIVRLTHEFPEWIKNNPGKSSKEIPLRDILEAVGLSSEADGIINSLQEEEAMIKWVLQEEASRPIAKSA